MVDFLVIGPVLNVTYKNVFHLIKYGDISFGWNKVVYFEDGVKFGNIRWFSNISDYYVPRLVLSKKYVEGEYKKYDHFDAINIDRIEDIPYDYDGVMGVPVSFLDVWNPGQFDVLRVSADWLDDKFNGLKSQYIDGKKIYTRLFIKRKVS